MSALLGRKHSEYNRAAERLQELVPILERLRERSGDGPPPDEAVPLIHEYNRLCERTDELRPGAEEFVALKAARAQHRPVASDGDVMSDFHVNEPDLYTEHSDHSFMTDLYSAQLKNEPEAQERINRHQRFEVEKRAMTSATLGGIIPAQYMVDLYAKAARNGRVFANEINNSPLPDVGMSVVIPRLTQGLAAAAQTTQNTAVVTQDVTETDLTIPVNTIAGYSLRLETGH